jgi:DNA-directed RNA polymerase delta subunit
MSREPEVGASFYQDLITGDRFFPTGERFWGMQLYRRKL